MSRERIVRLVLVSVLLGFISLLAGCSGTNPQDTGLSSEAVHIAKIASLYMEFRSATRGKLPATAEELKAWAKTLPKERLASLNIEDVDKAFISPRDNEPYVLVRPEVVRRAPGGMAPVLAYEKTGVNGKRKAVSGMGSSFDMDDEKF